LYFSYFRFEVSWDYADKKWRKVNNFSSFARPESWSAGKLKTFIQNEYSLTDPEFGVHVYILNYLFKKLSFWNPIYIAWICSRIDHFEMQYVINCWNISYRCCQIGQNISYKCCQIRQIIYYKCCQICCILFKIFLIICITISFFMVEKKEIWEINTSTCTFHCTFNLCHLSCVARHKKLNAWWSKIILNKYDISSHIFNDNLNYMCVCFNGLHYVTSILLTSNDIALIFGSRLYAWGNSLPFSSTVLDFDEMLVR